MTGRLTLLPKGVLLVLLGFLGGCAFFSGPPALPRRAAIQSQVAPQGDEKYGPLVENADIIYFPAELVAQSRRSEPAWKLIEALHRHDGGFSVAWDAVGAEDQATLDQWMKQAALDDGPPSHLRLSGNADERESCRAFLRGSRKLGARFLALRKPPEAAVDGSGEKDLAAQEFAAEKIADHFRARRSEKLLVFLRRRHLGRTQGVPFLVAQKIKARQLLLDSKEHSSSRVRLLALVTHGGGIARNSLVGIARRLEIVNRAPGAAGDEL